MGAFRVPFVSTVIPAYNREKSIRRCLDSILAQTLSPDEILVIDDCSSDGTACIVQSYADPRIRCISLEKNRGAQAARNRGIREAKGDWIAFQDSDDEWLPEKLEKQIKVLKNVGYDPWTVVHTAAIWFDSTVGRRISVNVPLIEGVNVYPLLLTKPAPFLQSMLVSRTALEKINYLDEKVPSYQEWDTSIRLSRHCRFIHIIEPLFVYHLHEGETISKDKRREVAGYQYVIDKFKDEIIGVCGRPAWENHLYTQLAKCLNFRFWTDADRYFSLITIKTIRYRVYQLFRLFQLSPRPFFREFECFLHKAMLKLSKTQKGKNCD